MSNKYALLIGITYPNTSAALPGCDNDVCEIYKFLSKRGFTNFDVLCDTNIFDEFDIPVKNPVASNIIHSFFKLLLWCRSNPTGTVFLHYSGHGAQVADNNWVFDSTNKIWKTEEEDGKDECMVTQDLNYISDDKLKWLFTQLPPTITLFSLMDSCHSGTSFDLKYYLKNINQSVTETNKEETGANVVMISGCKDEQYAESYKFGDKWYGVMSYSFLYLMDYMNKYNIEEVTLGSLWYNMGIVCNNFPQIPQSSSSRNNFSTCKIKCTSNLFDIVDSTPTVSRGLSTTRSISNSNNNNNKKKKWGMKFN